MRVLIAGCGDVGNLLAQRHLKAGHTVFGLKRNISTLPDGVTAIQADLTKVSTLTKLPEEIDVLFFMPTPARRDQSAYEAIFIDGWHKLWAGFKTPPWRTVLVSSTAVFGQSDGSLLNEASVANPVRFNGQVLLQLEQLAATCTDALVIARLSGIYGEGRVGLIRKAMSKKLEVQQVPAYFTNRIHRNDAAAALMHLALIEDPEGLYLVSDDRPSSRYETMAWLAKKLDRPVPRGLKVKSGGSGKRIDNQRLRDSGWQAEFTDYCAGYSALLKQGTRNENTK